MKTSKLQPYIKEINEWRLQGFTLMKIVDLLYLEFGVECSTAAVWNFAYKNNLKNVNEQGKHADKLPVCNKCENYIEVGANYVRSRNSNVKVCKACLECIPPNVICSPIFCPKRKGGDKE